MKRLISLLLALLLLGGCAPAPAQPATERTFFAMDTVMTLRLFSGGEEELLAQAEAQVREMEALWSVTDGDSEIYALNHRGTAELSPRTAELLARALELCGRTGGALDLSIYPVLRAWGFTTGEYAIPDEAALAALLPLVDYRRISLDGTSAALAEGMEIDLGSVANGCAGDMLAAFLREKGVTSATLDLGGNIQTVGARPDGSPWRIGVRDPAGEGNLGTVEVIDRAVVTSGGYERYFEQDGARYWHILDPATGAPARSGLASVTVVGGSGLVCDALSTALFVLGREGALDFWQENGQALDFELVLVGEDGSVTCTAGLEAAFTPARAGNTLFIASGDT